MRKRYAWVFIAGRIMNNILFESLQNLYAVNHSILKSISQAKRAFINKLCKKTYVNGKIFLYPGI